MEIIIALYLLSGLIKPTLMLLGINLPFDYVYVCLLVMIIFCFNRLFNILSDNGTLKISYSKVFMLFIFFNLFAILSGAYSLSTDYYLVKVLYIFQNILTAVIVLLLNKESLINILKKIIYITLFCGLLFILFYNKRYESYAMGDINKVDSGLELYLTLGLMAGLSFLICYYLGDRIKFWKTSLFLLALVLLISSARGPIVFTFLCFILYLIKKNKVGKIFKLIALALILFVAIAQFFPENSYVERFESRFSVLLNSNPSESKAFDVRDNLFDHAKEMISNKPILGYGLGSFGVYVSGKDIRSYPHNFIYEIFSETGIIGLGLFSMFILLSSKFLVIKKEFLLLMIICYLLLNFTKGHSIIEVKFYYFIIFTLLSIASTNKELNEYS